MPLAKTTLSNCYTPSIALDYDDFDYNDDHDLSPHVDRGRGRRKTPMAIERTIDPRARSYGDGSSFRDDSNNHNQSQSQSHKRSATSLRRIHLDRSILTSSTGSSLIEIGHTKLICSVHGPRPVTSSSLGGGGAAGGGTFQAGGTLNVELKYAAFGSKAETKVVTSATNLDGYGGGGAGGGDSHSKEKEVELSSRLHDAISPSIPLQLLSKSVVDVFIMVLQDDGSAFAASVVAASLALCDAGVEVYDLVSSCTVALIPRSRVSFSASTSTTNANANANENDNEKDDANENGHGITTDSKYCMLIDPTENELLLSEGCVTLATMSNWKEATFWDQTGRLPPKVAAEAAELCNGGCIAMRKFMRQCLIGE